MWCMRISKWWLSRRKFIQHHLPLPSSFSGDEKSLTFGLQVDQENVLRGGDQRPSVCGHLHPAGPREAPCLCLSQRDGGDIILVQPAVLTCSPYQVKGSAFSLRIGKDIKEARTTNRNEAFKATNRLSGRYKKLEEQKEENRKSYTEKEVSLASQSINHNHKNHDLKSSTGVH